MTSRRPRNSAAAKRVPRENWPNPVDGGSYVRDPVTGALTPAEQHQEEAHDGAEEIPEKTRTGKD